jgi:hypothetical protein
VSACEVSIAFPLERALCVALTSSQLALAGASSQNAQIANVTHPTTANEGLFMFSSFDRSMDGGAARLLDNCVSPRFGLKRGAPCEAPFSVTSRATFVLPFLSSTIALGLSR